MKIYLFRKKKDHSSPVSMIPVPLFQGALLTLLNLLKVSTSLWFPGENDSIWPFSIRIRWTG
jgi:hypothetical protein